MSGLAVLGQCWGDADAAATAVCSTLYPNAGGGYVLTCTGEAGGVLQVVSTGPDGSQATYSVGINGAACDPYSFPQPPLFVSPSDAATYAAAVIGVWIAAWCWRAVYRSLSSDESSEASD